MAHSLKRKLSQLNDSDEDEPTLGKQVLPVANLPDSFDGEPEDGLQYLFTVRRDARLLPRFTRVENPYALPEIVAPASSEKASSVAHASMLPSEDWRETFLRRFRNFRKNSMQSTIHVHIPSSSAASPSAARVLPSMKERDLWWAFLAGRPESEWNPPKRPKQPKVPRWQQRNAGMRGFPDGAPGYPPSSYSAPEMYAVDAGADGQPDPSAYHDVSERATPCSTSSTIPTPPEVAPGGACTISAEEGDNTTEYPPREPTPSLLRSVDHRYAMHLLMYFGHWISTRLEQPKPPLGELTQAHARWMFMLLSRVDDWITGDEMSVLRNLARGCVSLVQALRGKQTSMLSEDVIDERSCWLIVGAIAGVWGQKDLWMDAEEVLSKGR